MAYVPALEDVLRMPSGPTDHLFVIVAEAFGGESHQAHLLVNFSPVKYGIYHDRTCVFSPAQCRILEVISFVAYQFAEIQMALDLAACVSSGKLVRCPSVSARVLEIIRSGVCVSPHTPTRCRNFIKNHP